MSGKFPRVLVGTLYCGEGDYEASCASIREQRCVEATHVTISNLPEAAAHVALWNEWNTRRHAFDMFVKVDADTVLRHPDVLQTVWSVFMSDKSITSVQAPLYDYITEGNILGLNCFTPNVTFATNVDRLYCDRADVGNTRKVMEPNLPAELVPAGYHCQFATTCQAFHYGVHRALKNQNHIRDKVRAAFDKKVGGGKYCSIQHAALLGFEQRYYERFRGGEFDYNDAKFQSIFNEAQQELRHE